MLDILLEVAKLSPSLLYLMGVLFLYRENRSEQKDRHRENIALLERYHTLQAEQVKALEHLAERLER